MKVSIERLEELGLYQRPPDPPERPERLKALYKCVHDKTKDMLSRFYNPMERWQKEGLAAMACVGVVGLTITAVGLNINLGESPPGMSPGTVQTAYVPDSEMAAGATEDIKITRMSLMGSENTVDVMTLSADIEEQVPDEVLDEQQQEEILESAGEIMDDGFMESESILDEEESFEEMDAYDEDEYYEDTDIEDTEENTESEGIDTENAVIEEDNTENEEESEDDSSEEDIEGDTEKEPETLLVMANVDSVLNVRSEASEDSEQVGVLYKDTGGTVLEQKDGWTKIESGELVGWASDDYLVFGSEAKQKADESGNLMATIATGSLRVREEPNALSTILGYVSENDTLTVAVMGDNGWAEVTYNETTGYINADYASVELTVATGDTMEALLEKEEARKQAQREEAEARAEEMGLEMTVTESYSGTESDLELLATIIYCEAGNQSHEGKVAVGNVVINRVNSGSFPNTFEAVIRAPRQFSPVGSGKFDRVLGSGRVPESCYQAAQDAMDGVSYVGDCLYFKNPKIAGAHSGITIGDHVFW